MGQAQLRARTSLGQGSLGRKAMALTRRAWLRYWRHKAARATVGVLHALDDRTLKDIGLDRSEIESVAYGGCQDGHARERRLGIC